VSCTGGCLRGEEILFEEVLANKFFQIPLEALAVNGLVSFTVVIITVLFYSGEGSYWIGLGCLTHDRSLMALKTFDDGEPQRSEMVRLEVLGWIRREDC